MACPVLPQGLSSWDADAYVAVLAPVWPVGVLDNPPPIASSYLMIGSIPDNNHRVINYWTAVLVFGTRAALLREDATGIEFKAGRGADGDTYGLILHEVFHVFCTEILLDAKLHEAVELSIRAGGVLANQLFSLVAFIVVIFLIEPTLLLAKHPCHVGQPTRAPIVVVVAIEEVL